jgi:hypothetical protein
VTRRELIEQLETLKVNPRNYSLEGPRDEALCLDASVGGWRVFYFERGIKRDERFFESEAAAYDHFLGVIEDDPSYLD